MAIIKNGSQLVQSLVNKYYRHEYCSVLSKEDLFQEGMLGLLETEEKGNVSYVCNRIRGKIINISISEERRRKRHQFFVTEDIYKEDLSLKLIMEDLLNGLSKNQKLVVKKIYWEGKTIEEISKETNLPRPIVCDYHYRAKKKLKKLLD